MDSDEGGAELSGANEAAYLQDHARAARLAHLALTKTKPGADKHESAQLILAQALEALGYRQAAAEYYFAVAEQRHNPALLARAFLGIERLSRRGDIDQDKLVRGVLVEAELSGLPPKIADFLQYQRALANLRQGYRRWADKDLGEVRADTHYGRKVQLARAVAAVKEGRTDEALSLSAALLDETQRRFEKAREAKGLAITDEPPVPGAPVAVKQAPAGAPSEARLIRARLRYEAGDYEASIEEYKKVRKAEHAPAGVLLLERAWAHFRAGDHHDAMGLLYALGAPSNRHLFLPDQYILRGLIYQRFCHFRAAKSAVADYRRRYGKAVASLKAGAPAEQIPLVAGAARDLVDVAPRARVREQVQAELVRLERRAGGLENGPLTEHLSTLYAALDERSRWHLGRAMAEGSRRIAEQLLEAEEQANLLEYEVGISIFRPIREDGKVKVRSGAEPVPSHGVRIYYPFDEEFWSDELPNMRFLIQDRCVE